MALPSSSPSSAVLLIFDSFFIFIVLINLLLLITIVCRPDLRRTCEKKNISWEMIIYLLYLLCPFDRLLSLYTSCLLGTGKQSRSRLRLLLRGQQVFFSFLFVFLISMNRFDCHQSKGSIELTRRYWIVKIGKQFLKFK